MTPDPKFFFPSAKHLEALNSLIYAISERKGFVVITGEIGAGKTTVCRTLLNKLDSNTKVALINNTHLTCKELILNILEELEITPNSNTKVKLLFQLNEYLLEQLAKDSNVVLIIDEAQNLTPKVLEEVRMLSNLETDTDKLIQIILLGQPQLKYKLSLKALEQFKQRVCIHYHIYPLTKEETRDYIEHRLRTASSNGLNNIFSLETIDKIYEFSKGIPRLINLVSDSALLTGYIYETKSIDNKIMDEVIREVSKGPEAEAQTSESLKKEIYCCPKCDRFTNCEIKWNRGIKGEQQVCCEKCKYYRVCK